MMPVPDWSDERLTALAELPVDHPDVQAVRANPERWARLIALREFLYPSAPPAGARTEEAVARIRAAIRSAHSGPGGVQEPETAPPAVPARRETPRAHRVPLTGYWPVFAAAAVLVVAGTLLLPRVIDHRSTMRGTERPRLSARAAVEGDALRFSWPRVDGAERYELRLFHEDLTPLRPVMVVEDSLARLPLAELLDETGRGGTLYWRVTAMRSGLPLEESRLERVILLLSSPGLGRARARSSSSPAGGTGTWGHPRSTPVRAGAELLSIPRTSLRTRRRKVSRGAIRQESFPRASRFGFVWREKESPP